MTRLVQKENFLVLNSIFTRSMATSAIMVAFTALLPLSCLTLSPWSANFFLRLESAQCSVNLQYSRSFGKRSRRKQHFVHCFCLSYIAFHSIIIVKFALRSSIISHISCSHASRIYATWSNKIEKVPLPIFLPIPVTVPVLIYVCHDPCLCGTFPRLYV